MSLIIQHNHITGRRHFAQHFTDIRFVAFRAAFIDAASASDLFVRIPTQLVPVVNHDPGLSQLVIQSWRNDLKQIEIVAGRIRNKYRQAIPHGQPRSNRQHVF